ncbi:hypothetical protein BDV59DRAFT_179341 [Aspergillus ambiguus]|uniref:uncharacterized protein n=1 Tax=Aspergillus ambiguus TaxID=176160 RepID=UPI003CCCC45C
MIAGLLQGLGLPSQLSHRRVGWWILFCLTLSVGIHIFGDMEGGKIRLLSLEEELCHQDRATRRPGGLSVAEDDRLWPAKGA